MLLSIGMIVKNEEEHLRNCLNGIKPILDNVHSELIICDTGSTDSTVEIAKEFTDQVIEIEWRADFAWARNENLMRSKGRWYMTVDADEIFQNVDEIIEFFNSGEYRKFGCGSISMENILSGGESRMFMAMRLFRREKNTRWVGRIHEGIQPLRFPQKFFGCEVKHYGYDHDSDESILRKSDRNLIPLLEEYNKDPSNVKTILQISQEYSAIQKHDEALRYTEIGIATIENMQDEPQSNYYYHSLKHYMAEILIRMRKFEEASDHIEQYFKDAKAILANAIALKFYHGSVLKNLKRFEEAATIYEQGMDLMEKDSKGELSRTILSIIAVKEVKEHALVAGIVHFAAMAGDFSKAQKWTNNQFADEQTRKADVFSIFCAQAIEDKREEDFVKIYDYVANNFKEGSGEYDNALYAIERNLTKKNKHLLMEAFYESYQTEVLSNDYLRLWHLRKLFFDESPTLKQSLEYFLNSDKSFTHNHSDVIFIAMQLGMDFTKFIENMHITNTGIIGVNIIKTNEDVEDVFINYVKESSYTEKVESLKSLRVISMMASLLAQVEPTTDDDKKKEKNFDHEDNEIFEESFEVEDEEANASQKMPLFQIYIRMRHKYLQSVYSKDVYTAEMAETLLEQDAFAYFVGTAYEFLDKGDKASYIKNLRLSLRYMPSMQGIIAKLGEELRDKEMQVELSPTEKLTQEIGSLKTIINTLINSGNMGQAAVVLENYAQINPSDPEIEAIREKISLGQ